MTQIVRSLTALNVNDPDLANQIWQTYRRHFVDQPAQSIEHQDCYSHEDFMRILTDPEYAKFIIFDDGGQVTGYLLATWSMEKLRRDYVYVDTDRLKVLFPEEVENQKLLYLTSMATPSGMSAKVIDLMMQFAAKRQMMIAFDYSTEKLPGFAGFAEHQAAKSIARHQLPIDSMQYKHLGGQHYGAISFSYKK